MQNPPDAEAPERVSGGTGVVEGKIQMSMISIGSAGATPSITSSRTNTVSPTVASPRARIRHHRQNCQKKEHRGLAARTDQAATGQHHQGHARTDFDHDARLQRCVGQQLPELR